MDMYRILENFDAVNSKKTLTEGSMKRHLEDKAEHMDKADFVAHAAEYGMSAKEAAAFWVAVNGEDEEVNEERRSEEDWDAQALAQHKAKLAREKNRRQIQQPEKAETNEAVAQPWKPLETAWYKNPRGQWLDVEISRVNPDGSISVSGPSGIFKVGAAELQRQKPVGVPESDMEEGNLFTGNLAKARAAGKKEADLDGDGDLEKVQEVFPGTPEYELRFGKPDAASAFDKKKISTGTVYSRRYQDEPETDDDAPKKAGRPKGKDKGPERVTKGAWKHKGQRVKEHQDIDIRDQGEYDREGDMAQQQLHTVVDAARELHSILASDENLPEWVQSKITKALDYIDTARDYVKSSHAEREEGVAEASYSAKAARAGKDIGKPGKAFAKIAKSAGERYGSKERGEKVAGAVLAKLRAKEGVEEETSVPTTRQVKDYHKVLDKGISADQTRRKADADIGSTKKVRAALKAQDDYGMAGTKYDRKYNKEEVESVEEKAPPGAKAERMVKHIKAGYAKDGKLTDREKAIAYATAWKAKKAGRVEEESTETKDQHAERAGKKVTKDLEYDMKHKGKDDAKAEKAGKKVTKDIEYDDKKDKKKEVEETTVAGSVATAPGAAPKAKGGIQFGKGVYEGQVAESFEKKLSNILNEGMSVNVSTDDTGKKSISVNATDTDAEALGDLLKMAGLFSSEGYSRACPHCGGVHEAGACGGDMVEEGDLANSPDEVYADKDYMTQTLSGGLNGPKTTGQTTGPIVNRQDSRQGVMAEAERVKEAAESRLWSLYKEINK